MLLAHAADELAQNLWLSWNLDPLLLLGIMLFAGAYAYALGPLRRRWGVTEPVESWRVLSFAAGTLILIIALVSPLDALGDTYLFSAHMVQHLLISLICPPLWLLGTPGWMLAPLLRPPGVLRVARWLTLPVIAFGLFNGDLWLWHAPALYDATLTNETIHIFEHLTFIAFGVLFWWPVLSPVRALPRSGYGFRVLYLFLACQPMVALGALLTFAAAPLYTPYVAAPRIWGLSALEDQQLGGLIMWLPSNIPYVIALSAVFFKWVGEQDRAERIAAGELVEPAALAEMDQADSAEASAASPAQ